MTTIKWTKQMILGGLLDRRPEPPLGGLTGEEHEAARAYTPPRVLPATEQLRTNLERAATAYLQREQTLQREIADREAELADVRRARDAATAGLMELEGAPELDPDDTDVKQVAAFGGTYTGAPLPTKWANERQLATD